MRDQPARDLSYELAPQPDPDDATPPDRALVAASPGAQAERATEDLVLLEERRVATKSTLGAPITPALLIVAKKPQ